MTISETLKAQKYATIAEVAAAQAKIYADKLEGAPDYASQAQQSADEAANYAQQASDAMLEVNALAISASQSATSAEAAAAEAGDAAAQAVSQCIRVPDGESISILPGQSERSDSFVYFGPEGDVGTIPKSDIAILDGSGKIPVSMIPAIAISQPFVVTSQAEMLALDAQTGDVAKRTDLGISFILSSSPASVLSNWIQLNDDVLSLLGMESGASQIGAEDENSDASTVQSELNKIQLSIRKPSLSATYYDAKSLKISNLSTPLADNDAATKGYVDQIRTDLSQPDGALEVGNFASSAGVISAKLYGIQSGVDCAPILQQLQDLSESLRLPIDFSGIAEVRFTGRVQVGDWFHWKGAGRFNTVIKPLSLTQSAVGNNGGDIYAWFDRKDPTLSLTFSMLEDIGFDGQYQDGYEIASIAPTKIIHAFHWFFSGSAVGSNISHLRCHFKDCPGNEMYLHTEGGGQIDGVWRLNCTARGTDPYKTSIFFNAMKAMNGTTDAPGTYGVYTIRNIFSNGNVSYGHTRMHDLSRGCERIAIDCCESYEMNDCHHSADGSRAISMGPNLIGSQSGISFNTKNFIELQAEDVVINGGTYRATAGTGNAGQAGIFVADFKYGSESKYHQSKNIRIHNFKAYNLNSDAVRLNNVGSVFVDNISADSCNGAAVSWEVTSGHTDFITNAEIVPFNNTQGNLMTRGCLQEVKIPVSTSDVTIIGVAKNTLGFSRYGVGNYVYQTGKPYKVPGPSLKNNDRLLTYATSSSPAKTDAATQPPGVMYAFTLNDSNASSVQSMPVASMPVTINGNVFFDVYVLKGSASAAAVIFKEINSSGSVVNTTYLNAYVTNTWTKRSYIYVPVNAACAGVTIELAPACDTSGTASLTGTTSFADLQISDLPV